VHREKGFVSDKVRKKRAADGRRYYWANKKKRRRYLLANREKVAASKRRYWLANKERIAAAQRQWNSANREKVNAIDRRWYHKRKNRRAGKTLADMPTGRMPPSAPLENPMCVGCTLDFAALRACSLD
jgi:hypothetical protein